MGSLGFPEMVVIFILALVLFGPKKLPEIGRTLGKAITEFRKASTDLKATFEREMSSLEQETQSIKEVTNQYQYDTYNYDYSSYEPSNGDGSVGSNETAASPSTESASAPQGAESPSAGTPEGTVAYGSEEMEAVNHGDVETGPSEAQASEDADHLNLNREPFHSDTISTPAEHKA